MAKNISIRHIDRFSPKELQVLEFLDVYGLSEYDPNLDMRVSTRGTPFKVEDFKTLFGEEKCRGFVIEDNKQICGYLIYETDETSFRIRRIMIHGDRRRLGYGSTILDYLFEKAVLDIKRKLVVASVSEQYLEGPCAFLAHQGFSVKLELKKTESDILHFEHPVEEII